MAASSIQYLTTGPGTYVEASPNIIEHYNTGAMLQHQVGGGLQKLVAVQQLPAAAQPRNVGGQPMFQSGLKQYVALQPMSVANGAQRTYTSGTTYLHQAAPQPRAQQLPADTQIINAFNAEGQPVTIAINSNGTHILSPAATTMAISSNGQQIQQAQQVQMRQVPAGATLVTSQGQRIVQQQVGGEFQTMQSNGAPGIFKVVQQGRPIQTGDRYLVQTGQGQQVAVQRFLPNTSGLPIKQATTMQSLQVRQAPQQVNGMMAQPAGIQVGRSLIHVPNSTGQATFATAPNQLLRPNPNMATIAKPQPAKQMIQQVQPIQLPSAILVKPAGSTDGGLVLQQQTTVNGSSMQPQSLQQQVKDTVAQQRQQQLLASLRARVASLHQNGVVRPAGSQQHQAQSAQVSNGQIRRVIAMGDQPQGATAMTSMHLQPDQGSQVHGMARLNGMMLGIASGQAPQQQRTLNGQALMSLTNAQKQALMSGQSVDQVLMSSPSDQQQAMLARHLDAQPLLNNTNSMDNAQLQQLFASREHRSSNARGSMGSEDAGQNRLMLLGANGSTGTTSPTFLSLDSKLAHLAPGLLQPPRPMSTQPLSPTGSVGKDDLRAILLSIGVELARHSIDVKTAVEAGWLGVLSPTDVAVLQEAYVAEERRLANEAINGTNSGSYCLDDAHRTNGITSDILAWAGAASSLHGVNLNSRGSPAASIASAGGLAPSNIHNSELGTYSLSDPPAQVTEIDDAHFSAFAYDFFGGNKLNDLLGGEALEAIEPDNNSNADIDEASGHHSHAASSVHNAPSRAPSWPPATNHTQLQVDDPSMGCFSDMCVGAAPSTQNAHDSDNVSTTSSNHELVARIANLDLGCGFY